ncbi:adenosine deaminase, putative [Cordyceps militaris CM01]|uniref:Adenosine deaminase, putative n=1 Tax=Cordyceps militaris (strain CM01) TaxID=983644 RepID=G3JUC0_CORMM|nr:adenosine deaminase, putative [Cordyceps militaris CM01]EGX87827.1 adenosine deaminase, putative [Cordyceps militaris CM01]
MDYVALPKIELHAHLTGSVSRRTLHDIWRRKKDAGETDMQDPMELLPEGKHDFSVQAFFPLFSSYIYNLLSDAASLAEMTAAVLRDFHADGVVYLELRTTPRATPELSLAGYARTIISAISAFNAAHPTMRTRLLLSVDRRHDVATAAAVVDLAAALQPGGVVVGVDFCGDPTARCGGAVRVFEPVFARARAAGLPLAVHFGEAEPAGAREELALLLSWQPRRLGHVIWVDDEARREIAARGLCVELCLSCNVKAGMVRAGAGGFADHHFGYWRTVDAVQISLGTDDVGVFGSPLSNEYALAAEHFHLDRAAICSLAREAIDATFGSDDDKEWLRSVMWTS